MPACLLTRHFRNAHMQPAQASLGAPSALAAAQQPADAQEDLLASLLESQQMGPALKAIFDRQWQGACVWACVSVWGRGMVHWTYGDDG
jgi:hypothetical protein